MTKVGIIAGSGSLPLIIGRSLIDKKIEVCFFCIKNFCENNHFKEFENIEIELNSLSNILNSLNQKKINKIVMAGNITRPSLKDIKFDLSTISLIKNYLLESKGDDQLLKTISNFFLKNGFPLFDWKSFCPELFSNKDNLSNLFPSKKAINNMKKGLKIFEIIGKADIGQSLIIQNELVLGVECIEGTDQLIKRCYNLKKDGDKGILIKLSKYLQHSNLDVPTIGLETLKQINQYNFEGVFIEKNNCVILEKEKMINYCNQNNLFLSTLNKIEK
tara:strand:- start:186 stop:1007 length:822 start_codon:yes stop_codon:yes gene_type:complete